MDEAKIESMRVSCTYCRTLLKCPQNLLGRTVKCSNCGNQFRVPPPTVSSTQSRHNDRFQQTPPPLPPSFSHPRAEQSPPTMERAGTADPTASIQMTRQKMLLIGITSLFGLLVLLATLGRATSASNSPWNPLETIAGCVFLLGALLLYATPSIVAFTREHMNFIPILILNLFFGWTVLGWVVCLAWSFSSDVRESRQYVKQIVVREGDA